jgi:DNA-directed RNA polymerase subunit M/transcription elongation factor TFIIS
MPFFSPDQCSGLLHEFWQHHGIRCPNDGAMILNHLFAAAGGYLLVLACSHCGKKAQFTRFDPQRPSFRRWTAAEIDALAATCGTHPATPCPVCQTNIHYHSLAGSLLLLDCPRCGNTHQTCTPDMSLRLSA